MAETRIVIVGAGFAGAYTARHLLKKGRGLSVQLLAPDNFFVFQPLLPEVVGGAVNSLDTVTPLRVMLPGVQLRTATVRSVDFTNRLVEIIEGPIGRIDHVPYDQLVLAFGQSVNLARFPGLQDHAFTVKEAADAFLLRNHAIDCLERAGFADPPQRRSLLTFVVVGGGYSGVEVLGELQELVSRAMRYYPHIPQDEPRFILVEYQDRILPEVPERLAAYAARTLTKRGVIMVLGRGVKSAAAHTLELDDGTIIETETVVAAIGNAPNPLARKLGVELDNGGRIVVGPDMRLPGHRNVWAAGDAARVPLPGGENQVAPPTAQAAVRAAEVLADNVLAASEGESTARFTYRSKGALASLGGRRAVVEIYGTRLAGRLAWMIWRMTYVAMLPIWSTRIRVAVDQFLDLFLLRNIVRTKTGVSRLSRYLRHREGNVVIAPGQLGDGVYLVIEGSYEMVVPGGQRPRVFLPGDSFGGEEIAVGELELSRRTIIAREDSRCFVLQRDEYNRILDAIRQANERALRARDGRYFVSRT